MLSITSQSLASGQSHVRDLSREWRRWAGSLQVQRPEAPARTKAWLLCVIHGRVGLCRTRTTQDPIEGIARQALVFVPARAQAAAPLLFVCHDAGRADRTHAFDEQTKSVELARAANRATGTPVATYIHDGGHYWPPDTSARIIAFFKPKVLQP